MGVSQLYEGYEVLSNGTVWSNKTYRFLRPAINNTGYETVALMVDGAPKTMLVHRLVAKTYLPNPNRLPVVNHKDENKLNNDVSNLEWCTQKHNSNWGTGIDRHRESYGIERMRETAANARKHGSPKKRTVNLTTGDEYESALAASKATGIHQGNISACCNGRYKTAGGFKWAYKEVS